MSGHLQARLGYPQVPKADVRHCKPNHKIPLHLIQLNAQAQVCVSAFTADLWEDEMDSAYLANPMVRTAYIKRPMMKAF